MSKLPGSCSEHPCAKSLAQWSTIKSIRMLSRFWFSSQNPAGFWWWPVVLAEVGGGVQPSQFQVQILKHWNIWSAYLSLKKIRHRWKVSSKKTTWTGGEVAQFLGTFASHTGFTMCIYKWVWISPSDYKTLESPGFALRTFCYIYCCRV